MASTTILRFTDLRSDRWRNHGGTTLEIASDSDSSGNITWRLSLADIDQSGDFSLFPGTERILTVVDGDGMVLGLQGREYRVERGQPFPFSGDVAVRARLLAGSVRALNVITHRDTVRARVVIHDLSTEQSHHVLAGTFAVLISGRAVVHTHGAATELFIFDTVKGGEFETPEIAGQGLLAVVSLSARGQDGRRETVAGPST